MSKPIPKAQQRAIDEIRQEEHSSRRVLLKAAERGWAAVLRFAVDHFGDRELPVSKSQLLRVTTQFGHDHAECAEILLSVNADPNSHDVMEHCGVRTLPLLASAGGVVNGKGHYGAPLLVAIKERTKQDKSLALLDLGADPNVADPNGVTALMHAAVLGRNKVFDTLVREGGDLFAIDETGRSIARHLVESLSAFSSGASPSDKRNAMRIARQLVKVIPTQPEDHLLLTIALDDAKSLQTLLADGLDPETTIHGALPFLGIQFNQPADPFREPNGTEESLATLSSRSAQDRAFGGLTLLMWATALRQVDCMRVLVRFGADPDSQTNNGHTARSIAEALGDAWPKT